MKKSVSRGARKGAATGFRRARRRRRLPFEIFTTQRILDTSMAAIATATLAGRIAYANNAFLSMWGIRDLRAVLGKSVISFWADRERAVEVITMLTRDGEWTGMLTGRRPDGSEFIAELKAAVVYDGNGKPAAISASFIDRTSETTASRLNGFLASVLRSVREAVIVTDLNGLIHYWNDGAETLFGYRQSEMIGRHIGDTMNPGRPDLQKEQLETLLRDGSIAKRRHLRRADGSEIWVDDHVSVLRDENGNAVDYVGVLFDVTEEVRNLEIQEELVNRLLMLRRIDRDILLAEDPEQIADAALASLVEVVACVRASVVLLDAKTGEPVLFRQRSADGGRELPTGAALSLRLFGPEALNPVRGTHIVRDVRKWTRVDPYIRLISELGIGAYASIPMVVRNRVVGFLNIGSEDAGLFTERVLSICEQVAYSLALVIQHRILVDESRRKTEQLRSLAQHRIEIQDDERKHIARGLHDLVGNNLSLLSMQVHRLQKLLAEGGADDLNHEVDSLAGTVSKTAQSVRELTEEIHPSALLTMGLVAAVREYCARLTRQTGIPVGCVAEEENLKLEDGVQTESYYAIIEALSNSLKHSRATWITVSVARLSREVLFSVSDNGLGFNYQAVQSRIDGHPKHRGWGFVNIQERIDAVGGGVTVSSHIGEGTTITIRVPTSG